MLTRKLLLTLLILFPFSTIFAQGERIIGNLTHESMERDYILYIPSDYDPVRPMPLVLNFHGYTSTAGAQEAVSGIAEREGFLVAYPNAVNRDWLNSDDHNISFVESLLDTLTDEYSIDSQRVYATGASQGGTMSFVLAAALPDRFAAAAPLAGTRPVSDGENRVPIFLENTPVRAFPLLYMHGSADTVVPYDGGFSDANGFVFPPVSDVLDEWVDINGGTSLEPVTTIPGFNVTDGPAVSLFQCGGCGSYTNEAGDLFPSEVIHMRINGTRACVARFGHSHDKYRNMELL